MVWENVPGAFSSAKGEDFRAVLEETARIADENAVIPRPEGGSEYRDDVYNRKVESATDNADRCVCCGEIIPEGRQVCPKCEGGGK
jgi:hypothetical protein